MSQIPITVKVMLPEAASKLDAEGFLSELLQRFPGGYTTSGVMESREGGWHFFFTIPWESDVSSEQATIPTRG